MCGIAGIFSVSESASTVAAAMNDAIRHRGPDDTGIALLKDAGGERCGVFAHRRLAIIDLSMAGHQPMLLNGGAYTLTYNGEIFNFLELREELAREGVSFRSASDTEVILAGWARHGPAFLGKLRGMFALAIWDSAKGSGFLARDTFGIKPLYVAEQDGALMFASEVRALLATGSVARVLSREAVRSYLSTGSVAEPLTIVEGVTAIPPGSVVEVVREGDRFVSRPPFAFRTDPPAESTGLAPAEHARRIRSALRDSVRYHLVADVPVAVFLSGGIDSTAVAGLASEVSDARIESFTVVFDEAEFSEAIPARASAERFGTVHHEILLSGTDLLNALPDVFRAMDQPSLDGLNTFVVSRAVHSFGLKVVMSGLGGDELFGGYPSFHRAKYASRLWKLPGALRRIGAGATAAFEDNRASRMTTLLRDDDPAHAAYVASRTLFADTQVSRLLGPMAERTGQSSGDRAVRGLSLMQQISHYELTGYMRNTLLRDSDVFSMAHGLELRVPLVDVEVARVARDAAAALDLKRGAVKPMLVDAVRDLLSDEIISQPKRGFTLPFERWMQSEMFGEVDSVLSGVAGARAGVSGGEVASVWRAFQRRQGGVNWSRPWALYTLIRWASENDMAIDPGAASFSLAV